MNFVRDDGGNDPGDLSLVAYALPDRALCGVPGEPIAKPACTVPVQVAFKVFILSIKFLRLFLFYSY